MASARHVELGLQMGCALDSEQTLWCWGHDSWPSGERQGLRDGDLLGNAHTAAWSSSLVRMADDVDLFAFSGQHLCIARHGEVSCRGANAYGQTTDAEADHDNWRRAILPVPLQLAAGWNTTCALTQSGVWCWGRLGPDVCPVDSGPVSRSLVEACSRPVPHLVVPMPGDDPYERIVMEGENACAITREGHLACWSVLEEAPVARWVADDVVDVALSHTLRCTLGRDGIVRCRELVEGILRRLGFSGASEEVVFARSGP